MVAGGRGNFGTSWLNRSEVQNDFSHPPSIRHRHPLAAARAVAGECAWVRLDTTIGEWRRGRRSAVE